MKVKRNDQSFIITIKNNQNATWQGVVKWLDEDKSESFRSTLELIRLLDSAIPKEETKEENS